MDDIRIILAEIQKDLKYHIKRTDMLEEMVKPAHNFMQFLKHMGIVITLFATIIVAVKSAKSQDDVIKLNVELGYSGFKIEEK